MIHYLLYILFFIILLFIVWCSIAIFFVFDSTLYHLQFSIFSFVIFPFVLCGFLGIDFMNIHHISLIKDLISPIFRYFTLIFCFKVYYISLIFLFGYNLDLISCCKVVIFSFFFCHVELFYFILSYFHSYFISFFLFHFVSFHSNELDSIFFFVLLHLLQLHQKVYHDM